MKEKRGRGMLHPVAFINNTFNYLYIPTNIIITSALASLDDNCLGLFSSSTTVNLHTSLSSV